MRKEGVCVLCATYNQEKYICHALDSILEQKTTFPYVVFVHDDASTDSTKEILLEYKRRYPEQIKLFIEEENQFSQGIDFWSNFIGEMLEYKYICHCEGDDFWLDSNKIQMQYEILEQNRLIDMSTCCASMVAEDGTTEVGEIRPKNTDGILTIEETVLGGGMFLSTNTLFYRSEMLLDRKQFEIDHFLDYSLQIRGALRGGIFYIDKKMAAYRRSSMGSWTSSLFENEEKLNRQCETEMNMLRILDSETNGKYHSVIEERLRMYDKSFYEQLYCNRDNVLRELQRFKGKVFLWGLGRRGKAFERFLLSEKITIEGACDITNQNVGEKTVCGNVIYSTNDVENIADVILTSTTRAYEELNKKNGQYNLVDLQPYMKYE